MTGIQARDLPDLRIDLSLTENDLRGQKRWANNTAGAEKCWTADGFTRTTVEASKAAAVPAADLFYVAPNMAELAEVASQTMPDFEMHEFDFPSPAGLLILGKQIDSFTDLGDDDDCQCGHPHHHLYSGLLWHVTAADDGHPYVLFYPVVDAHASLKSEGRTVPAIASRFYLSTARGVPLAGRREHDHNHAEGRQLKAMLRVLRTSLMLMQQPLAEATSLIPDRATQKRVRRANQDPKAVRVIELRRPQGPNSHSGGTHDYHHQWIVRGHWRNHWHPKREVHRPLWIAPHIKGPEGAPLLGGEKVYALNR